MCRRYPPDPVSNHDRIQYFHCDGTPLRLADSEVGLEWYSSNLYYVWQEGARSHLLFIFSTTVTMTTTTLHYYSDSIHGLPRLRFYAVPDDFDVWDVLDTSYSSRSTVVTAVQPGREPVGRMNVSINFNFNTKKVVMFKAIANFQFAVSEVEFFICNS